MSKRIKTGVKGLDTILDGGFLRHNSILLKGAPGTGKTSLGIRILLQGIEDGEGGIICSFEQFPQQLQRDTQAFGWNLDELVAQNKLIVLYVKPDDFQTPVGSSNPTLTSRIHDLAETIGARRLLLDSVTHFNRVAPDPVECRSLMLQFINEIKTMGITPIMTAELMQSQSREYSFEEYLVDEVVLLHNELSHSTASLPQRTIEVTKTRGHSHVRGRHPLSFVEKGIEVYPHVLPEPFTADELAESKFEPVPTGVPGVDPLIGGGYPRGTATIISGMAGTYKTTLAAAFLADGAARGENGLLLSFQETPQGLIKMLAQRGVDLTDAVGTGKVAIHHQVAKKISLDAIFAVLCEEVAQRKITRVVLDSLDDFERCIDNPCAYKDYLLMFLSALSRAGATTLLTQKLQRVSSSNPIADIRYVSMVDTVIYLGNVEIESSIHKVISVLKSRAARPDSDLREIHCDSKGLHVSHKFHGLSGILQGTARGQFKKTVENIFQPLYFVRDFARMGSAEQVSDAQRRQILGDVQSQLGALEAALKDYFGFDPEEEKKR
jgi:circadian clock protein KaiC